MTLPSESTRVNIVAGVHFQVISAGNTPEIVTICGMVDILSIDACQISNPRKSVAGTFHKKQINCDNIRIPDSALVRVKVMTLGPESTMTPPLQYTGWPRLSRVIRVMYTSQKKLNFFYSEN